ncbi:MAG: ATPase [Firmicutes bacterium HGW-Firmicutes-16]|nr:MAG: ATPase [Firmicutes bacterium HGW-Firmicutes-16]
MELEKSVIGIELGSTRIKAVLLDERHIPVASGNYEWENHFVNGVWTYAMDEVHKGLHACYAELACDVRAKFNMELTTVGAIGVSAMMHGYLPFDRDGKQLAEFRTWRNTITGEAAEKLSTLFGFNIPQRWSIAHLYQAILNGEAHVEDISFLTTLAGYVHWQLTGEKVIGIGEASGMFPIDSARLSFNQCMVEQFDQLICNQPFPWKLRDVLPKVLPAGVSGGMLIDAGALFLDPTGTLKPGVPVAPCEGDAGTGMVATNSVRVRTGNVSAGTSDFAMLVSDHDLGVHREIDMVTTPTGLPVAMVHCNNCTSDINAWVNLFSQFADAIGEPQDKGALFTLLFNKALEGDADCGGLLSYNYFSGEGVTDLNEGRPVFARFPNCNFSLANFMRSHLLSALATLKIGLDILTKEENVQVDKLYGHGGFFKTPVVGQKLLSAAVGAPVSVMVTAGEGGPFGMALLCTYMLWKDENESLEDYLDNKVFKDAEYSTLSADVFEIEGFNVFLEKYKDAFEVERTAVKTM